MTARKFLVSVAGLCALTFSSAALADFDPVGDDTDIFLANPLLEASRPNVLFFVDNTANWNTAFDVEKKALYNSVSKLVTDAFNVGMGMFVETGSPNDNIDGAYIRFGLRQMTPTNKARFLDLVDQLDQLTDKGNNATYSLAMDELFRYFAGKQSAAGIGKVKRDFFGNKDYNPYTYDLDGAPFDDEKSDTYRSPIVSGCQKNFIIFISNGPAGDNSSSNDQAKKYLDNWAASTSPPSPPPPQIALSPNGEQGMWADEYSKFMAEKDCSDTVDGVQNVFTYTIDVLPPSTGQGPSHTALLKSMANAGKGRYFAVNSIADTTELENILRTIFVEVQAVNSVFASVALPVSVNVRGTNLNQVYIGQFRPDKARGVRWFGNLKMYKIGEQTVTNPDGTQTKTAFLVDRNGNAAENPATGFVSPTAESFWTATSSFWGFRNADENGAGGPSDLPDGDLVEKGGAAQRIRTLHPTDQSRRQVYTCTSATASGLCKSGDSLSATPFDTGNADISAGALGTYVKKPVVSITATDNGNGTATATATVTAHGFATNDVVKITGATPNVYNTDPTAVITKLSTDTFSYQLPSVPAANVARVVAANHNLATADTVTVKNSTQAEYNVGDAPVTRIDANTFEYGMSGSNFAPSSGHIIFGKKRATTVTGVNLSARAVVPSHGYGSAGSAICCIDIEGANEAAFNVSGATVTIVDANTFDYVTPVFIAGTADTARVSATAHGLVTGYPVTISGSTEPLFNGVHTITRIDANTFTFSIAGLAAPSIVPGMVASIGITSITHPTTGSGAGRDIATVTTSLVHGFTNGQNVVISGTGLFPATGYDGTWAISNVTSTSFTITNALVDSAPPSLSGAGMLVGRAVQRIDPVVTATGTILSVKQVTPVTSVASKAVATGGNITAGRPADADLTDRDNLINWVRGRDNYENEKPDTTAPDVRPSVHGDVLHSRPAVVNYGRGSIENDVYIFYGANDGSLRAVKGGLGTVTGDNHPDGSAVQPGDERWSFIPTESFGKLDRQRTKIPFIDRNHPRDYFVDGAVSAFTKDVDGDGQLIASKGDAVYGYFVLRRGGDSIYALDISDPGAPKFLWRKKAGDPGYAELGQTWSEAKVVRINANTRPSETAPTGNPDNLVLVMGAGYDPGPEDQHPCLTDLSDATKVRKIAVGTGLITFTTSGTCSVSGATGGTSDFFRTKGRGIMVIDALDGHVIWQAGPAPTLATHNLTIADMAYAIPSDVRVVDLNGDGFADSAVVGDTGGNIWRLDLADVNPKNWRVRKVATLASTTGADITNKRKFMFAPEVVVAQDTLGLFLGILVGSGDREHPFDGVVKNRFYMLKDRGEAATLGSGTGTRSWSIAGDTLSDGTGGTAVAGGVIREVDLYNATVVPGANDSGWLRDMAPGEKIVSSALVVGGNAIFSTNQPTVLAGTAVDACASNLGVARIYTIAATDGSGTATVRSGGGYVPSAVFAAIQLGAPGGGSGGGSGGGTSTGACVGAACSDQTTAGGGLPPGGPTTGIVCTGTSCWSVGNLDVNSRRRSYWYRAID